MKPIALANLFKALSNERRIRIMRFLLDSNEPLPVTTLSQMLNLPQGPVSWNLSILAKVGLVIRHPSGTWVLYSPNRTILKGMLEFFETKEESE